MKIRMRRALVARRRCWPRCSPRARPRRAIRTARAASSTSSQALRDKDKGNTEDYQREMNKAVQQLEQCATEDPADFEAIGYLGWAYAEVDSAGPAGEAFQKAIDGLKAKGDKKKVEWVTNNRESYWAGKPSTTASRRSTPRRRPTPTSPRRPTNDAEKTLQGRGRASNYDGRRSPSLTRASLLKPGRCADAAQPGLGVRVHGRLPRRPRRCFARASKLAPARQRRSPTSLKTVRANYAAQLLDEKKYDEAIAYYAELIKTEPNNADLHLGHGRRLLQAAPPTQQGDAAQAGLQAGGRRLREGRRRSRPTDADLPFNAALSYQNAGEWALAEAQWRAALKLRPDDVDALSALGADAGRAEEVRRGDQGAARRR